MNNEQVDFNENEDAEIKQAAKERMLWLGDPRLSWKKRIFQIIATIISWMLVKFGTNLKWQFFLIIYLAIVCPVGTWTTIKTIVNWIF